MACCGDVPTLETLAAVDAPARAPARPAGARRQRRRPDAAAARRPSIPHGLSDAEFDALFTTDRPVVFAYHGYPWLIHRLTYRRTNHDNIHVRGYKEEGTTTTPFDMVMLNDLDRFHLVMDVIDRRARARRARGAPAAGDGRRAGCAPARGRASTARISPRSATGPGPTDRVGSVLVVNAGSTSLKLRVVDENEEARDARVARAGRHGRARRRRPPRRPRRAAAPAAGADRRRDSPARFARSSRSPRSTTRPRSGRSTRRERSASPTCRTSPSSTRRSTRRCRRRRRSTRSRALARGVGNPPLRLSRPLGRVERRARRALLGRTGVARRLPPRRRLLGHGGARTAARWTRRWASARSRAFR